LTLVERWRVEIGLAAERDNGRQDRKRANVAMGIRLMQDITFDATPAAEDFGWNSQGFHPVFDQLT
jgi:hypothetical protein